MFFRAAARLAVFIGLLMASASGVAACGLWIFCDPKGSDYPPMRVPIYDHRLEPVWTSNGWIHPSAQGYVEALPHETYPARRPRRAPEWSPPPEPPAVLK